MRLRPALTFLTLTAMAVATAGLGAGTAQAATALPAHVFAPYFEAYNGDDPAALAQQSGAKYLTMAFVQAATKGSCTVYWDGDTSTPIAQSTYGSSFATIRANGGDVIPSFGGYAADNGGTEIADSCTDVNQIAAAYEHMITTYDVSRLDFDIEDNSLTNSAGIDRRNKAMKQVEDWAAANGRSVQFSYTLPTTTSGLADNGMAVLRNAVSNGARVDVVNMMTFDYYDGANHEMANDTESSANGLISELAGLYPGKTQAQLWAMVGITEMVGVDDYGPGETFTTADATTVYNWAVSKGINTLSFWALQRDNGSCPGRRRGRQLLGDFAEHLAVQPHLRAVHQRRKHAGQRLLGLVEPGLGHGQRRRLAHLQRAHGRHGRLRAEREPVGLRRSGRRDRVGEPGLRDRGQQRDAHRFGRRVRGLRQLPADRHGHRRFGQPQHDVHGDRERHGAFHRHHQRRLRNGRTHPVDRRFR